MVKGDSVKKTGRPLKHEALDREKLVQVGFRADRVTLDAIAVIEAAVEPEVPLRKSVGIRRALQEVARRISADIAGKKKTR